MHTSHKLVSRRARWGLKAVAFLVGCALLEQPFLCHALDLDSGEEVYISDTDRFPGWKGTLPGVKDKVFGGDPNRARTLAIGSLGQVEWTGEIQQLSWAPRLYLLKNFLSEEECNHLINLSEPELRRSEVVDVKTGGGRLDDVRTSSGSYFARAQTEIIGRIEDRIARVSFVPVENGEGLQVLRYQNGEQYRPHHDFFWDKFNADEAHGGQRLMTILMYLSTVEEGGETVFPQGQPWSTGPQWSACAQEGLSVKTRKGDAVMFYSLHPNGTTDETSEHGSCPVIKGTKWSATKWIHVGSLEPKPKGCEDEHTSCFQWARAGECQRNAAYMLKSCRKSCETCEPSNGTGGNGTSDGTHADAAGR